MTCFIPILRASSSHSSQMDSLSSSPAVGLRIAAEAYRSRLSGVLTFVEEAASARTQIPTETEALQHVLDGCMEYVFAGESAFNAARQAARIHEERFALLVALQAECTAALRGVQERGARLAAVRQQHDESLNRLHVATARLAPVAMAEELTLGSSGKAAYIYLYTTTRAIGDLARFSEPVYEVILECVCLLLSCRDGGG